MCSYAHAEQDHPCHWKPQTSQPRTISAMAGHFPRLETPHLAHLWPNLRIKVKPRSHIKGHLFQPSPVNTWILKLSVGGLIQSYMTLTWLGTQAQISHSPVKKSTQNILPHKSLQKDQTIRTSTISEQDLPARRSNQRPASFRAPLQTASCLPHYCPGRVLWLQG